MTVAAKWSIRSDKQREDEAIEKWGRPEWTHRKAICEIKRDELEEEYSYDVRIIVGGQFETIMVMLDQEKFDMMATLPVWRWRMFVEKLILGK